MVRAVLFDLDDTLFDHRESAAAALRRVQHAHACFRSAPFHEFERQHSALLEELHPEVLNARMGIDAARRERFRRLFLRFGFEAPDDLSASAASQYRREYLEARRPMAGAQALLEAARARVRIGVVSNNLLQEQKEKLDHCGLAAHVDALVVSEEAGVSKPDPAIFEIALKAVGAHADEAVMLGDSWSTDIVGARTAGIRAVWFNPLRLESPEPELDIPELYSLEPTADALAILLSSPARARARQR
jgi:HAD superfamily hydrolase (TIGR01549 family)